ncbi:tRNA (adenosine(37)-N6)-threonylcarbamoyltransferase complex dimerization subunit type 1 TsaB [Endozoicomonas ascidiicola]|uniref:tRNA (adenosine(37)-N6)-threonylcarbamoyltransferase complex dimerization subunit type 1 TsaB n=1 Tax=Endozoicomonas ascidiicola TaxID=1698521 RepID=UPI0008300B4F|nr:tRNA (adenosine(37)-N6)-threonylcarbamoyltransferase complex dimerization subunit type 1 TsaB [Endozoicomonas ascidiicola]
MKILALDTATEACSVALNLDGEVIEHFELSPRRHSRDLLPMVESLLAKAGVTLKQLDAIAFGRGPGAFTGLRVATAMTQGLAYAVDLPVIPVSTLAALAQQAYREQNTSHVLSAIDARMSEVYWGAYKAENGLMTPMLDEQVIAPQLVSAPVIETQWYGIGTGWAFREQMPVTVFDCVTETWPRAYDIALLAAADFTMGKLLPAEQAMPVYLRDKVALKKSER